MTQEDVSELGYIRKIKPRAAGGLHREEGEKKWRREEEKIISS